uniref:Uncharacterized protein n=1 Tax=Ascaris lumbricoides TaxID=6252 RepID=A0A0M3HQH1_ASCLU
MDGNAARSTKCRAADAKNGNRAQRQRVTMPQEREATHLYEPTTTFHLPLPLSTEVSTVFNKRIHLYARLHA